MILISLLRNIEKFLFSIIFILKNKYHYIIIIASNNTHFLNLLQKLIY